MRGFLAAALLGALALPARADIVDSGSLVIGQQGIIGGTMTVQGNAFSVGGSTFSVLEGSVSVGGLLKPSSTGIQWADGTVSTTAVAATSPSGWVVTQSFTMSSDTSAALSMAADGSTYKIVVGLRQTTSYGDLFLRFNNDSASNYYTETQYAFSTGSASFDSGNGVSRCYFSRSTGGIVSGSLVVGEYVIHTNSSDNTQAQGFFNSAWRDTATESVRAWGSCFYDGSSQITNVYIMTGTGDLTGTVKLLKLQ